MTAAQHYQPSGYHSTMKTPVGLVYAVIITVAILAVVLFARSQSSSMIAPASMHAPPPESEPDKPAASSGEEPGAKDAEQQQAKGPPAE